MVGCAAGAYQMNAKLARGDGEIFVEPLAHCVVEPCAAPVASEDAMYVK